MCAHACAPLFVESALVRRLTRATALAPQLQPGNVSLEVHDPEMFDLIEKEKNRQWKSLELIASEVRHHSAQLP